MALWSQSQEAGILQEVTMIITTTIITTIYLVLVPDHGTMLAFDICISAPNAKILDYVLFQSNGLQRTDLDGFSIKRNSGFS